MDFNYGGLFGIGNMHVMSLAPGLTAPVLAAGAVASLSLPTKISGSEIGVLSGSGIAWDVEVAKLKAFAELTERYSAYEAGLEAQLSAAPAEVIRRRIGEAILPAEIQHFTPEQNLPARIVRCVEDRSITWTTGKDLFSGSMVAVPALSSYLQWTPPAGEPLFLKPNANGLAAAETPDRALLHALFEVLERDACMRVWRLKDENLHEIPDHCIPEKLKWVAEKLKIEYRLFVTGKSGLPPTAICVLLSEQLPFLACGTACGEPSDLASKAFFEALLARRAVKQFATVAAMSTQPRSSLEHVLWANEHHRLVYSILDGRCRGMLAPQDLPSGWTVSAVVAGIRDSLGGKAAVVDVTSRAARASGWSVVRVIATAAQPRESDAAIPHLRFDGINQERVANLKPHPFG